MPNRKVLHVYSSGAVAPPIKKNAEEFKAEFGTEFEFTVGKAENLIARACSDFLAKLYVLFYSSQSDY